MKNEDRITLSEWNTLTSGEKENLKNWAIQHGYELDLVPGSSGSFDPVCDYAALLKPDQMVVFLKERSQGFSQISKNQYSHKLLWERVKAVLKNKKF